MGMGLGGGLLFMYICLFLGYAWTLPVSESCLYFYYCYYYP